jgi:hypothetical protein
MIIMIVGVSRRLKFPPFYFFTAPWRSRHFVRVFHHFSIHLISGVKRWEALRSSGSSAAAAAAAPILTSKSLYSRKAQQ